MTLKIEENRAPLDAALPKADNELASAHMLQPGAPGTPADLRNAAAPPIARSELRTTRIALPAADSEVAEVFDYVRKHAFEPGFAKEQVASHFGVSRRTIERYLSEVGTNFQTLVTNARVEHGMELLREGHSVKETSARCGYLQMSHFSRVFKEATGATPSEYAAKVLARTPQGSLNELGELARQHNYSIKSVAKAKEIHPRTLERFFKRLGLRASEWFSERRMEHAKEMLSEGDLPLKVISSEVGVSQQSHFSRLFKRLVGVTPSEYRAIKREQQESV